MSEKKWSLENSLAGYTMDNQAREIVRKITKQITRDECVALVAEIFAAERMVDGSSGNEEGTMCIGTDVFALFPFTVFGENEEKNHLVIFFSYRDDGTMWLSDFAKGFGLAGENSFKHKYAISPVLKRLPDPRLETYEILTAEQLQNIGMIL